MSLEVWIILYLVTFIAAILRGAIGMGFGLMVLPFYLLLGVNLVPVTVILLGLLLSCLVVIRDRKAIDLSGLKFSLTGRFLGNIVAVTFISFLTGKVFDLTIGLMILLAVGISLLPLKLMLSPKRLFFAGFGSGVMGTISSLDGPPIALLYQHQKGEVIRATLGGYFIVGALLTIVTLAVAGKVEGVDFVLFFQLSPPALLGFLLSKRVISFLNEHAVRVGILVLSLLSGILILVRAFL